MSLSAFLTFLLKDPLLAGVTMRVVTGVIRRARTAHRVTLCVTLLDRIRN